MPNAIYSAPKLYTVELGRHRCIAILRANSCRGDVQEDSATGCLLYMGKTTQDGHWQISRQPRYITRPSRRSEDHKNRYRSYYMHRIAYVALHGTDLTMTGSHLCGHANCFNPYHIVDESQQKNNDRQRCLGFIICPHHNTILHQLCQHKPAYVKPLVIASHCCLLDSGQQTAISLPLIQRVHDFLKIRETIADSDFINTDTESAEETESSEGTLEDNI